MTVVLPLPVAIFSARRNRSGLAWPLAPSMWRRCGVLPAAGATSVSQISVSTASTWQKKGRTPAKSWLRQCCSRRAVVGVTPQSVGIGQGAPGRDVAADLVDDRRGIVGLRGRAETASIAEGEGFLLAPLSCFFRLGDRGDELRPAPPDDGRLVERLSVSAERVMTAGRLVGRVEDRFFEEAACHVVLESPFGRRGRR